MQQPLSLLLDHLPTTIHAQNIHRFGGPDAVTATGADIFAVVAVSADGCCARLAARCVPATGTPRGEAPFNAVHLDIGPALVQDELTKSIGRLGDAPPNSRVITDVQITSGGSIAEFLVVVGAPSAGVLDALLHIPQMDTFVQHGGNYIFDGTVQRPRADVQLVPGGAAFMPRLGNGYMTIGPRGTLYRDDRFLQLAVKVSGVDGTEDFFQVTSGPGGLDGFFHLWLLTFVSKISNSKRALKIFVLSTIVLETLG